MLELHITVDTSGAQRKVVTMTRALSVEMLPEVAIALEEWALENIIQEGAEEPWPPLARSTLVAKVAAGLGTKPLVALGNLLRSLTVQVNAQGSGVTLRFADPKASFAEYGTAPHEIRARAGGYLVFATATGWAFAKSVRYPGSPPRKLLPSPGLAALMTKQATARVMERVGMRPRVT